MFGEILPMLQYYDVIQASQKISHIKNMGKE